MSALILAAKQPPNPDALVLGPTIGWLVFVCALCLAAIVLLDSDVLLGAGVALMFTPGHTVGNHTIVLNTSSGVWTVSENGMHAEAYSPERSRIPGLRDYHQEWGFEVVLNSNTPESSAVQYNSMVKEKLVADRGGPGGEWVQHFPSSEMSPWRLAVRTGPSFTYGAITEGELAT